MSAGPAALATRLEPIPGHTPGPSRAIAGALLVTVLASAGCGRSSRPAGAPEAPRVRVGDRETGDASWYGPDFHGKRTASGERYNMFSLTAAHRTLPLGTIVRVENLDNHLTVEVRINDRGPFLKGRIIDLSYQAARAIKCSRDGTARVRIEVISLPKEDRTSESVDPKDLFEDPVGLLPLAEEDAPGIVDLHVRE
jgi:hypothetical protein